MPIKATADGIVGVLSVMDRKERVFSEEETHLIKIFTHNVAHEMEHHEWQRQVKKAQKMDLIFQIATGVTHEVRNPLNAILAISESSNTLFPGITVEITLAFGHVINEKRQGNLSPPTYNYRSSESMRGCLNITDGQSRKKYDEKVSDLG